MIICAVIALDTNTLDSIVFYDVYFSFMTLFIMLLLLIVCIIVGWNLHTIISKQVNNANEIVSGSHTDTSVAKSVTLKLTKTRNKIVLLCCFLILGTILLRMFAFYLFCFISFRLSLACLTWFVFV